MIVDTSELETVWPRARGWIAGAMEYSMSDTAEDWLKLVCAGKAQLWLYSSGAALTRVVRGKKISALHIVAVGGVHMHEWISEAIDEWSDYASREQCEKLVAVGRPGWKRVFNDHGFEINQVVATKALH